MPRQLKSGTGWRIGWDSDAELYRGLVGGEGWAIELTEAEFAEFCRLVDQLANTMNQMSHELMDEERISCEVESDLIWVEAEGYPQFYELHFMVLTGRQAEGSWSVAASSHLVQAIHMLDVF
jgi:hypothetical protein